jgi:hypothetical protein
MKFSKCLLTLSVFACLTGVAQSQTTPTKGDLVSNILSNTRASFAEGSGVGGGVVYDSIIAWCDETGIILDESRTEAREVLGFTGNHVSALRSYHGGLMKAAEVSQEEGSITVANSVTLKYVARGLKLAQLLGLTDIINGDVDNTSGGLKQVESLVTFFDWYVGYTKNIGESLDKVFFVPYIMQRDCRGQDCGKIPTVSTIELEKRMFNTTVSFLKQLEPTFVRLKTDQNSFYTVVRPVDYLKALSFITIEVSKDLNESLFANAYACQARKLGRLADQMKLYVQTRGNGEMDAIKLNKYTLEMRQIIAALDNKRCF